MIGLLVGGVGDRLGAGGLLEGRLGDDVRGRYIRRDGALAPAGPTASDEASSTPSSSPFSRHFPDSESHEGGISSPQSLLHAQMSNFQVWGQEYLESNGEQMRKLM